MVTTNPFGLHTITPYLIVHDAKAILQFLEAVFGAKPRGDLSVREDGSVKHAEVTIGDSVIMMCEATEQFEAFLQQIRIPGERPENR